MSKKNGTLAKQAFDYSALEDDASAIIRQHTTEIRAHMGEAAQNIVDIGARLLDVKERLEHGQFGAWLKAEFKWSEPTALRMMRVAGEFKNVNLTEMNIAPSALYLLSAPSTPKAVKDDFKAQISSGKDVTHAEVRRAVPPKPKSHADNGASSSNGSPVKAAAAPLHRLNDIPDEKPADANGRELPARLVKTFSIIDSHYTRGLNLLAELSGIVNDLAGDADARKPMPGGELLVAHRQQVKADLKNVRETLKSVKPHAVCPYCGGEKNRCEACKGLGWVARAIYESAPSETKGAKK